MGLFKNFRRKGADATDSDATDSVSQSEESWEKALSRILPRGCPSADILSFIARGQPAPVWNGQQFGAQFAFGLPPLRAMFEKQAPTVLAVASRLSPDQRQRFGDLLGCQWDLRSVAALSKNFDRSAKRTVASISLQELQAFGPTFGWAPDALATALVNPDRWRNTVGDIEHFPGFDEFVKREIELLAATLSPAKHAHTTIWRRLKGLQPDTLLLLAPQICDAATASSKELRKQVRPLFEQLSSATAEEQLKLLATTAKPAQRAAAVTALATFIEADQLASLRSWAMENLADDRAQAVQEAIAALVTNPVPPVERPTLPPVVLGKAAMPNIRFNDTFSRDSVGNLRAVAQGKQPAGRHMGMLSAAKMLTKEHAGLLRSWTSGHFARILLSEPHYLVFGANGFASWLPSVAYPRPLEISAVAAHDNLDETAPIQVVTHLFAADPTLWAADEITQWVAYHAEGLQAVLEHRDSTYSFKRSALFETLAVVDPMPSTLQSALINAAVVGYKTDRPVLAELVGIENLEAILPYLKGRKRDERLGAAEWLKAHPSDAATEALLTAARKESDDGVKSALLTALEVSGQPLDEFLSPESLLADATKALSKKNATPKTMSWLNLDALPQLSWADGSPVAKEIAHWFLVLAVKQKTAEPSPLLRRHFDNMDQATVRAFGGAVLDLWLAEDLACLGHEESLSRAQNSAPRIYQEVNRPYASSYYAEYEHMNLQQITDKLYASYRQAVAGSATTSKGLLAVAAASAGPEVADRVLTYIRKHRGHRASQAKVLLQMLAWIDEPATVQAVMSVATRFRPKGIQAEALKQANELAERRGWTLDDLADRSVPDAGFESNGRQVFDYGTRTFTAHLGDDLSISLTNDETEKTVRSLPKGRATEDEEAVKEAKKDFAAAKKELKGALKLQPDRLHLAMCVQRQWTVDDFSRYFLNHPLMIRLITRLVWIATPTEGEPTAFRPLTDGTILGVDDDEVELTADMKISIAHQHLIGEPASVAWQAHFADYEIQPLFGQLGRPQVTFDTGQTVIRDYQGYKHNDGSIRGQMNRYAWELGPPQDAGIVEELIKRVPTADLTAVITLGNGVPAGAYDVGSWPTSVGELYFVPGKSSYYQTADASLLADVSPILLTEFYAEYEAIATSGNAPDAQEEKS